MTLEPSNHHGPSEAALPQKQASAPCASTATSSSTTLPSSNSILEFFRVITHTLDSFSAAKPVLERLIA